LANDDVTEVTLKPRPSPAWREHARTTDCKQKQPIHTQSAQKFTAPEKWQKIKKKERRKKKKEETAGGKYNSLPYSIGRP